MELVDLAHSKCAARKGVWVRSPPLALNERAAAPPPDMPSLSLATAMALPVGVGGLISSCGEGATPSWPTDKTYTGEVTIGQNG